MLSMYVMEVTVNNTFYNFIIFLLFYCCAEQKFQVINLTLKYILVIPPITLKRKRENVTYNDGLESVSSRLISQSSSSESELMVNKY